MDPPPTSPARSEKRNRLPGAMEVQNILSGASTSNEVAPTPAQHVRSPTSPKFLSRSSSTSGTSHVGHTRTFSLRDSARKTKRLTLQFPIQAGHTPARTPSPTRSVIPESLASPTGPTDSCFLTALAAQERRVLELKEELQRAEQDLRRLKLEWAAHEAQKKRHDARRVQKLQPLSTNVPNVSGDDADLDGGSAWMQQEMERRKALLSGTKASSRTVFSGSRHARALSLLSPTDPAKAQRREEGEDREGEVVEKHGHGHGRPSRPSLPGRWSTDQDLTRVVSETVDEDINLDLNKDVLIHTGKKMASDFKDGLWTFIEDLRQATIGDEGINGTHSRVTQQQPPLFAPPKPARPSLPPRTSTTTTKRSPTRSPSRNPTSSDPPLIDVGSTFWKENGLSSPQTTNPPVIRKPSKKAKSAQATQASQPQTDAFDNGWDTWDSPAAPDTKSSRSNSETSVPEAAAWSPSPERSSPRTSVR